MDTLASQNNILLTGADSFILAMEKKAEIKGTSGNICRYVMELEGRLDFPTFCSKMNANPTLQFLASLKIQKTTPLTRPKWVTGKKENIYIDKWESNYFIPQQVLSKKCELDKGPLFFFDIVYRENGNTCVVFSWNHLLMDGYGVLLLLRHLTSNLETKTVIAPTSKFNLESIKGAVKAKFFIGASKEKPLSGLSPHAKPKEVHPNLKVIHFTKEETFDIDLNGPKLGAKFGPSPFYLACTSIAIKETLLARGEQIHNFWVPVPQNSRKKGAIGPLLGNHISFLFYLLGKGNLASVPVAVKAINQQMVQQAKQGIPKAYEALMFHLRRIPYRLYHHYTRGPKSHQSLSSFLFTVAEDHPKDLATFEGMKVIDAYSFPPNIYPPGVTFAFMRFNGCLRVLIQ